MEELSFKFMVTACLMAFLFVAAIYYGVINP